MRLICLIQTFLSYELTTERYKVLQIFFYNSRFPFEIKKNFPNFLILVKFTKIKTENKNEDYIGIFVIDCV
jgi:hypothetical protein